MLGRNVSHDPIIAFDVIVVVVKELNIVEERKQRWHGPRIRPFLFEHRRLRRATRRPAVETEYREESGFRKQHANDDDTMMILMCILIKSVLLRVG